MRDAKYSNTASERVRLSQNSGYVRGGGRGGSEGCEGRGGEEIKVGKGEKGDEVE